ncbi:MAG: hypothetical protein IKZ86_11165 [Spirochaetaceae bacterium]|nr:hypothetical protein [Spirochaetaceae bacterium]
MKHQRRLPDMLWQNSVSKTFNLIEKLRIRELINSTWYLKKKPLFFYEIERKTEGLVQGRAVSHFRQKNRPKI